MKNYFIFLTVFFYSAAFSQQTLYNRTYRIACHNCYDPSLATKIEDVFSYTTTIEMDIWDNFQGSGLLSAGNKMNQDWYVKHDILQKGNLNCCGGSFRDCLIRIKAWADINPTHDVITVFVDKKENWSDSHESRKPIDFDQLIVSIFSKASIYSPANLLGDKKDLKQAALTNWPSMDSLKGKFIFVITDGTEITTRNLLSEYLETQKNSAICFVAPQITSDIEITAPTGFTLENAKNVAFYNLEYPSDLSRKIEALNCLTRMYNSPETKDSFHKLLETKINFIALDNYKINK